MHDWLLSSDAAHAFLRDHWQRAPAFLPGALVDPLRQVDWRALAGRDDVESRQVICAPGGRYLLEHGPFDADALDGITQHGRPAGRDDAPWTVLIQDADQFDPRLRALLGRFRFLPDWRVEDVMVSFATPGASVGPHVDAYDVFLVQAEGERRWQVGAPGSAKAADSHGSGLRLVQPFDSVLDVIARPGDVLYLPPGVPHHGVAQTDCVTLSVGFRAPDAAELAAALLEESTCGARYADPPLTPASHPALIDAAAIDAARDLLRRSIDLSPAAVARTLGRLVTEPKDWFLPELPDRAPAAHELRAQLRSGKQVLRLTVGSRVALSRDPHILFVNGEALPLPRSSRPLADVLTRERLLAGETLASAASDTPTIELLTALLSSGALYWQDENYRS